MSRARRIFNSDEAINFSWKPGDRGRHDIGKLGLNRLYVGKVVRIGFGLTIPAGTIKSVEDNSYTHVFDCHQDVDIDEAGDAELVASPIYAAFYPEPFRIEFRFHGSKDVHTEALDSRFSVAIGKYVDQMPYSKNRSKVVLEELKEGQRLEFAIKTVFGYRGMSELYLNKVKIWSKSDYINYMPSKIVGTACREPYWGVYVPKNATSEASITIHKPFWRYE